MGCVNIDLSLSTHFSSGLLQSVNVGRWILWSWLFCTILVSYYRNANYVLNIWDNTSALRWGNRFETYLRISINTRICRALSAKNVMWGYREHTRVRCGSWSPTLKAESANFANFCSHVRGYQKLRRITISLLPNLLVIQWVGLLCKCNIRWKGWDALFPV